MIDLRVDPACVADVLTHAKGKPQYPTTPIDYSRGPYNPSDYFLNPIPIPKPYQFIDGSLSIREQTVYGEIALRLYVPSAMRGDALALTDKHSLHFTELKRQILRYKKKDFPLYAFDNTPEGLLFCRDGFPMLTLQFNEEPQINFAFGDGGCKRFPLQEKRQLEQSLQEAAFVLETILNYSTKRNEPRRIRFLSFRPNIEPDKYEWEDFDEDDES